MCDACLPLLQSVFPLTDVTAVFLVVMCVILFAPMIFDRLRIPTVIGMILAGVLLGEHGLHVLARDTSIETFGQIGLYYIMFLAGLEMNLEELKKNVKKSALLGALTFSIPLASAFLCGRNLLGLSVPESLLAGAMMASHVLVAYPIVARYGLSRQPSVIVSVGATMVALTGALFILAGVASGSGSGLFFWLLMVLRCALFIAAVVFFFPRISRWFFARFSDNVAQFIFVLVMLCVSALLSRLAGLDAIFGAFLCGLVFSRYIPHVSPLMNRVEFVGNALFIPYFLIGVGMIINVGYLFSGWDSLKVVLTLVLLATLTKWVAALLMQKIFRMHPCERQMMFALTNAHAAGALAILMTGRNLAGADGRPLVGDELMNATVLVILVSCIVATIVADRTSRRMLKMAEQLPAAPDYGGERIMVAYSNPEYTQNLTQLALMLRLPVKKEVAPSLFGVNVSLNDSERKHGFEKGNKMLAEAVKTAAAADVVMTAQNRVGTNVAQSLQHAAFEHRATDIVMGMHHADNMKDTIDSFFGSTIRDLVRGTARQVMVLRSQQPVNTVRRVVVFVPSEAQFEAGFYHWLDQLCRIGVQLGCQVYFYAHSKTIDIIERYVRGGYQSLRVQLMVIEKAKDFLDNVKLNPDHLLVIVNSRRGTVSWQKYIEKMPVELVQSYQNVNLLIIYPSRFGEEAI